MNRTEIISEIIKLESAITQAVLAGHQPTNEDIYQKDRERIKELREKL